MKDTMKSILNAPIVQRLRLVENRRVERATRRRKFLQTKVNETAVALDAKVKEDLREQLKDLDDLFSTDGYDASIDD